MTSDTIFRELQVPVEQRLPIQSRMAVMAVLLGSDRDPAVVRRALALAGGRRLVLAVPLPADLGGPSCDELRGRGPLPELATHVIRRALRPLGLRPDRYAALAVRHRVEDEPAETDRRIVAALSNVTRRLKLGHLVVATADRNAVSGRLSRQLLLAGDEGQLLDTQVVVVPRTWTGLARSGPLWT